MKRFLMAALMTTALATPALAAKLYLKDGGVIEAKRVWRAHGKVYVLATRDTMTAFEPSEVNLKQTFPHHRRAKRKKVAAVHPVAAKAPAAVPVATLQSPAKKNGMKLPGLPKLPSLPEKTPDSLVPSSGGGGTIKQHKKEMADRIGE